MENKQELPEVADGSLCPMRKISLILYGPLEQQQEASPIVGQKAPFVQVAQRQEFLGCYGPLCMAWDSVYERCRIIWGDDYVHKNELTN